MVNKVFLVGRLGGDPDMRYTNNGTAVCNFSLATSEKRKVGEELQDHTEWHKIVVWGKQAEVVANNIGKGSQVHVEGSLETQKWQDKEGNNRYTTQVKAAPFGVTFLGGKGSGENAKSGQSTGQPSGQGQQSPQAPRVPEVDEDSPF